MNTAALRVVRDVQRDRLTDEQRDQLAALLIATIAAVHIDGDPADPWAPVAAALRELTAPVVRRSNVVPLRPCSGRPRAR